MTITLLKLSAKPKTTSDVYFAFPTYSGEKFSALKSIFIP